VKLFGHSSKYPVGNNPIGGSMGIEIVANYTSWTLDPREFARRAESLGFTGVSCSDHFFRTSSYPHLWVSLAAMAGATERVMLTSSFANNLFRSPVEFVQAGLTVQAVSDGRFEAGLGAGWLAPEVVGAGLEYPDAPSRARRYREAILVARELLDTGHCTFQGEFYDIDVPVIGPLIGERPPLVASLGGPWTIRNIAPLVDRVELKFGRSTRGGDLDMAALSTATREELAANVAAVREVAPDVPIGLFAMIGIGTDAEVAPLRDQLGDGLYASFVGSPAQVRDALESLTELGVDRVQVTDRVKGSVLRLHER
jgi:alkanesulfonate monooxygenase SsuD/methylene tetrahydromethanopterin reductase-like flavin-dependent oxidoreductase (luciferase family)